jgi:hypothetical protein
MRFGSKILMRVWPEWALLLSERNFKWSATQLTRQWLDNPGAYHWVLHHSEKTVLNHTLQVFQVPENSKASGWSFQHSSTDAVRLATRSKIFILRVSSGFHVAPRTAGRT